MVVAFLQHFLSTHIWLDACRQLCVSIEWQLSMLSGEQKFLDANWAELWAPLAFACAYYTAFWAHEECMK
jgi:hypothetical protein